MNPINYLVPQQPLFSSALEGLKLGSGIAGLKQQADQQAIQQQALMQKAAEDEARKKQFTADVDSYFRNPTYESGSKLMMMYPEFKDSIKNSVGAMKEGQKAENFGFGLKLENALESKDLKTAQSIIQERKTAYENAGRDVTDLQEMLDGLADGEGDDVLASTRIKLFALDEPTYIKIQEEKRNAQKAPLDLAEQAAKTKKAIIESGYIDQEKQLAIEKSGADIEKIKADIDYNKEANKLRAMEAQLKKENTGLRAQELQQKIAEQKRLIGTKVDERLAANETYKSSINTIGGLTTSLRKHPGFNALFGFGTGDTFIPGSDAKGAEALLNELKANAFSLGLEKMRGLGAVGEKEGAKIEAGLASLEPGMPERDAIAALDRIDSSIKNLDRIRKIKFGENENANTNESTNANTGVGLSNGFVLKGVSK